MSDAVVAEGLTVRYGPLLALDDVSLRIGRGKVLAVLGPNGAGKTTCTETLLGYRRPDAGTARVLACDPVTDRRRLVPRIGAMLQQPGIWPSLSPRGVLELVATYYDHPEDPGTLLELLGLTARARQPVRRLSGGEQQRLSLAMALLPRPDVLFLDEPTAGVDPEGRLVIRDVVTQARARGAAVLLCTHDLADVEAVADDVVVLHHGRVAAAGALRELTAGGTAFRSRADLPLAVLAAAAGTVLRATPDGWYRCEVALDAAAVARLATALAELGAALDELRHGTTLEARYLSLVGAERGEPA